METPAEAGGAGGRGGHQSRRGSVEKIKLDTDVVNKGGVIDAATNG